jgi:hypothetical protein
MWQSCADDLRRWSQAFARERAECDARDADRDTLNATATRDALDSLAAYCDEQVRESAAAAASRAARR